MSDQQHLGVYLIPKNGRTDESSVSFAYGQHPGYRMNNIYQPGQSNPQGAAYMNFYQRNPEGLPFPFRHMVCQHPLETQMPNPVAQFIPEFQYMGYPAQSYPAVVQRNPGLPTQAVPTAPQQQQPRPANPPPPRERRPLDVFNPATRAKVNLDGSNIITENEIESATIPEPDESPPSASDITVKSDDVFDAPTDNGLPQPINSVNVDEVHQECNLGFVTSDEETPLQQRSSENRPSSESGESDSESPTVGGLRYNRAEVFKLKNDPAALDESPLNASDIAVKSDDVFDATTDNELSQPINSVIVDEIYQECDLEFVTSDDETPFQQRSGENTTLPESEESDSESPTAGRLRYNRAKLLKLKNAPAALEQCQRIGVRHADYKGSRKPHRGARPSQIYINIPTNATVKRVEGAFIPTHMRKDDADADGSDGKKLLSRNLNIMLNRVSGANLSETVTQIKNLKLSSPEELQLLVHLVFEKAIRQMKYIKVFVDLCKQLKEFAVAGCEYTFESLFIRKTQEMFDKPLETLKAELSASLDQKIANAKDEATKIVIEEDRETIMLKKTESYFANMALVAHLFLSRMVTVRTIDKCLKKLRESQSAESLESMLILLRICGQELEQQTKNIVDVCFLRLEEISKSDKIPSHQAYKILELIELRSRGWKEYKKKPAQEDKSTRVSLQTSESRHRNAPPTNPVTLAVSQQSTNSRKLGPANSGAWVQGSGRFSKAVPEDLTQTVSQSKGTPSQSNPTTHSSVLYSTLFSNAPIKEDYSVLLDRTAARAREIVNLLPTNIDPCVEVMTDCKVCERPALLNGVLKLSMEKKSPVRVAIGTMCCTFLKSSLLTEIDITSTFHNFFGGCDEDWLEDYPLGWKQVADVLQSFVQLEDDRFSLILKVLEFIRSNGRAAIVLSHCIRFSLNRLSRDVVLSRWNEHKLNWKEYASDIGNFEAFSREHLKDLEFLSERHTDHDNLLNELSKIMKGSSDESINTFFRSIPSNIPGNFLPLCIRRMVQTSQAFPREKIDHLAMALGIFVDHTAERERQVLTCLQEVVSDDVKTTWLRSLLDNKVISVEALKSFKKMHKLVMHSNSRTALN